MDDEIAVAGAAGAKVGILADAGIHGGFLHVRSFIDDHRGVARTGAEGRRAGAVSGFDHRPAARGDDEIRARHELLRYRDAGAFDALEDIRRRAFAHERFTHDVNSLFRYALCARMGRENHDVAGLDGVDGLADGGDNGVRRRDEGSDDANGLCVFDDALFRDLFDDAYALCTQRVAQDALCLVALADLTDRIAEAGLFNGLISQRLPRLQVHDGPCDGLDQFVHTLLVIGLNDLCSGLCTGEQLVQHFDFFYRDFSFCHCGYAPFLLRYKALLFWGAAG